MGKNLLICFIGVDGSGKTTHAKEIESFLKKRGYLSKYVRVASRPIFLYPFLFFTKIMGFWEVTTKGAWMDPLKKAPPYIRTKLGNLFRFLLLIDFVIITFVKVRLPLQFVKILICDRYVYDLIMELTSSNMLSNSFTKLILTTTPHPHKIFLADAPLNVICKRRPEIGKDSIRAKQDFYKKLAKIYEFQVFDTSKSFKNNQLYLQRDILLLLNEHERINV